MNELQSVIPVSTSGLGPSDRGFGSEIGRHNKTELIYYDKGKTRSGTETVHWDIVFVEKESQMYLDSVEKLSVYSKGIDPYDV